MGIKKLIEKILKKEKIKIKTDIATGIEILKNVDRGWKNIGYQVYKVWFKCGDGSFIMIRYHPSLWSLPKRLKEMYFHGITQKDILDDPSILLERLKSKTIYPKLSGAGYDALGIPHYSFHPATLSIIYDNKKEGHFPSIEIRDGYGLKDRRDVWGNFHLYGLSRKERKSLDGYKWDKIIIEVCGEYHDLKIAEKNIKHH